MAKFTPTGARCNAHSGGLAFDKRFNIVLGWKSSHQQLPPPTPLQRCECLQHSAEDPTEFSSNAPPQCNLHSQLKLIPASVLVSGERHLKDFPLRSFSSYSRHFKNVINSKVSLACTPFLSDERSDIGEEVAAENVDEALVGLLLEASARAKHFSQEFLLSSLVSKCKASLDASELGFESKNTWLGCLQELDKSARSVTHLERTLGKIRKQEQETLKSSRAKASITKRLSTLSTQVS